MTDTVIILLFILGIVFVLCLFSGSTTETKKEYSQDQKDKVAIELLRGADPDEVAEREGVDVDTLTQWKNDFLGSSEKIAEHRNELLAIQAKQANDLAWFEEVCKKYIGENWKDITGYDQRNR